MNGNCDRHPTRPGVHVKLEAWGTHQQMDMLRGHLQREQPRRGRKTEHLETVELCEPCIDDLLAVLP